METRLKYILIIGGIIIVAIVVVGLFYQNLALFGARPVRNSVSNEVKKEDFSSTAEGKISTSGVETGQKPYAVEVIPSEKIPSYRGAPVATVRESEESLKSTPEETRKKLKSELTKLSISLAKTPDSLDSWLRVGSIKHYFGDSLGARDAWEYAGRIRPANNVSFLNLASLYGYYLKDPVAAEKNYLTAIKNDPHYAPAYFSLASFYRDAYREKYPSAAEKVLLDGLAALPLDLNILKSLAFLYKDIGNTKKAIEYFEKYLAIDPQNDAIREELEALRRQ